MKISDAIAYPVLDSNGQAACEVSLKAADGRRACAFAPCGSTVGGFEAPQLYDNRPHPFFKGVDTAIANFNQSIAQCLIGVDLEKPLLVDQVLLDLASELGRDVIGANVSLAASFAGLELSASILGRRMFELLTRTSPIVNIPCPMINIVDGIVGSATKGLEVLAFPADQVITFEILEKLSIVQSSLESNLRKECGIVGSSFQGGSLALRAKNPWEMMQRVSVVIDYASTQLGLKLGLGIDLAASSWFSQQEELYRPPWSDRKYTSEELVDLYSTWQNTFPLQYIEDGLADTDYFGWEYAMKRLSGMIAGDDLYATCMTRFNEYETLTNSIVIKPNQVGTVTETLEMARLAKSKEKTLVFSQRSYECESTALSHIAMAAEGDFLKAGGLRHLDRVAKYNETLRICSP